MSNLYFMLEETQQAGGGWLSIVLMVVALGLVIWLPSRNNKKQEQKEREMRDALAVGDEVTTIGGIVGTVVSVKDEKFVLETGADQVRIEFAKWAISTNETAAAAAKADAKKAQEERAKAKAAKKAARNKDK